MQFLFRAIYYGHLTDFDTFWIFVISGLVHCFGSKKGRAVEHIIVLGTCFYWLTVEIIANLDFCTGLSYIGNFYLELRDCVNSLFDMYMTTRRGSVIFW